MLIIWQGWGFMPLLLPFLLSIPFDAISSNSKTLVIGWSIGGTILYLWGKKLHDPETNNIILYDEEGQGYRFKKHIDTFFWIPLEFCGIITSIGAFIIFICWIVNQT